MTIDINEYRIVALQLLYKSIGSYQLIEIDKGERGIYIIYTQDAVYRVNNFSATVEIITQKS